MGESRRTAYIWAVVDEQVIVSHKKNPELRWFASTSSSWLLKKARDHNKVRGQASAETTRKSGNWRVKTGDEVSHMDALHGHDAEESE